MLRRLIDRALLFALRRSHSIAQRVMLSTPCRVAGQRFQVPVIAGAGLANMSIGPNDIALMRAAHHVLAHCRGAVIDVGCNIGHFMQLCLLAGRTRRYVGFDISLACCSYVERFIQDNRLPAHQVFAVGLSDRTGVQHYLTDGAFDVCASLCRESHQAGRFTGSGAVMTERGDTILAAMNLDEIALIKIDVEGAEPQVLRGLRKTISRARPYVIFEVLSYAHFLSQQGDRDDLRAVAEQRRRNALEIDRFFRQHDYLIYRLQDEGGLEPRPTVDPEGYSDDTSADHLALPREKAAQFLRDYPYPVQENAATPQAA